MTEHKRYPMPLIGLVLLLVSSVVACGPPSPAAEPSPSEQPPPSDEPAKKPAEFELSNLVITPPIAKAGEMVTVTADVTTTGEIGGSYSATLMVNGSQVQTRELTLSSGATETVSFNFAEDATGSHTVEVGELSGFLIVIQTGDALAELKAAYPELYEELLKLPDLEEIDEDDVEALEDIAYLALLATNPEVAEAFELMIRGGTPDPSDYRYKVPDWNTELQVLFWLAEQNEFKRNDTLAQAIAMVNGLWVTMGDDEVREAVCEDCNTWLDFFRETDEIQKAKGYHQLEDYPLEAKICLAWTGNQSPVLCLRNLLASPKRFEKLLDLKSYRWNTLSVDTARQINESAHQSGWVEQDEASTIRHIEEYFVFTNIRNPGDSDHWVYLRGTTPDQGYMTVQGESVLPTWFGNTNFLFQYYQETGKGIGSCIDMAAVVDSWAKSCGIASAFIHRMSRDGPNHTFVIFYDPGSSAWKPYEKEVRFLRGGSIQDLYLFRPPVYQNDYLESTEDYGYQIYHVTLVRNYENVFVLIREDIERSDSQTFLEREFDTSLLKQWLLYPDE